MSKSKPTTRARYVRCTVPGISVQFAEGGHLFQVGEVLDLEASPIEGVTWREALGSHLEAFEPATAKDAGPDEE
jgi:hypothetical protein